MCVSEWPPCARQAFLPAQRRRLGTSRVADSARMTRRCRRLPCHACAVPCPWRPCSLALTRQPGTLAPQVHPELLTKALLAAAEDKGGAVRLAAVVGVEASGRRVTALRLREQGSEEESVLAVEEGQTVVFAMGENRDPRRGVGCCCPPRQLPSIACLHACIQGPCCQLKRTGQQACSGSAPCRRSPTRLPPASSGRLWRPACLPEAGITAGGWLPSWLRRLWQPGSSGQAGLPLLRSSRRRLVLQAPRVAAAGGAGLAGCAVAYRTMPAAASGGCGRRMWHPRDRHPRDRDQSTTGGPLFILRPRARQVPGL